MLKKNHHKNKLSTILYEKRIDIALITETHFTLNSKYSIPGYKLISAYYPDNACGFCNPYQILLSS